jgi:hypothetical protein
MPLHLQTVISPIYLHEPKREMSLKYYFLIGIFLFFWMEVFLVKNLKTLLLLIILTFLFVINAGYTAEIKNIARNPSFEDGTVEWQLLVTAPAAGKWESEKEGVAGKCVHITISAISGTDWHIEIHQSNQALKASQKYTFNFWAKTADKRIRVVGPGIEGLGGSDWWETFNIDEKWKEFSKTWVQAAGGNATIHFGLGQSKDDVWLDHIRLYEGDYQKEDLEQFKEKQGIELKDKLATTWSNIKTQ